MRSGKMFNKDFIEEFAEVLDVDPSAITDTYEIGEWSSLIVLSTIAIVDDHYDLTLKMELLSDCKTVGDLFQLVTSSQKE